MFILLPYIIKYALLCMYWLFLPAFLDLCLKDIPIFFQVFWKRHSVMRSNLKVSSSMRIGNLARQHHWVNKWQELRVCPILLELTKRNPAHQQRHQEFNVIILTRCWKLTWGLLLTREKNFNHGKQFLHHHLILRNRPV